ncbi:plastocyanin/azurin family copper-binding protein [Pseudomonas sp. NA-150]|uniref:cupredoxin domain-containing protein n=1 Tax=Pseudomonas sp. NA-150 TaxID=3367525 RepID=UPI0037C7C58E
MSSTLNSLARVAAVAGLLALSLPSLADAKAGFDFGHAAPAAQATRTVEVTLGDLYFQPSSLRVKAGETVRFVLTNKGQLRHEFNLGSAAMHAAHQQEMLKMGMSGAPMPADASHSAMDHGSAGGGMKHDDPNSVLVEPGKTAELTWTFTKVSDLQFACNFPGHYQAGMVGKVDIVD